MKKIIFTIFALLSSMNVFAKDFQFIVINDVAEPLTITYVMTNESESEIDMNKELRTATIPGKNSGQLNELSLTSTSGFIWNDHLHIITAKTATKSLLNNRECYLFSSYALNGSLVIVDHGADNPHLTCISSEGKSI